MRAPIVLLLALGVTACSASSPPAPTPVAAATIPDVTVYLAQARCPDGVLAVAEAGCSATPQTAANTMLMRRFDWPATSPGPYQAEDSLVADTGAYDETLWDFAPYGPFVASAGDGGEVYVTDGVTVRISITEDGGTPGVQGFYGAGCGGTGWVAFRDDAPTGSWASLVASLSDLPVPSTCAASSAAYTQYRLEQVALPFIISGVPQSITLPTVITEHYAGSSIAAATSMERTFFAQGIGRAIWESWVIGTPATDTTGRCPGTAWSTAPGPGWVLSDCRTSTNLVAQSGTLTGDNFGWPPAETALP